MKEINRFVFSIAYHFQIHMGNSAPEIRLFSSDLFIKSGTESRAVAGIDRRLPTLWAPNTELCPPFPSPLQPCTLKICSQK